ncbi:hypothetical protein ID866_12943 [Astraeus odoratus]|nr:hypothetical protein ID866_12943 [Astraeus odoratus]
MSLDDIPTEDDIRLYVRAELANRKGMGETEVEQLARKSDGLFEWARLACQFIKTSSPGRTVRERFDEVMRQGSEKGKLLDAMYHGILDSSFGQDQLVLTRFYSVMQQVLSTFEPLPMHALNAMRAMFLDQAEHYEVEVILGFMGPLLGGVTDASKPIRPLHASFYDFLTDASRSRNYFIGGQTMDVNLASASLCILHILDETSTKDQIYYWTGNASEGSTGK